MKLKEIQNKANSNLSKRAEKFKSISKIPTLETDKYLSSYVPYYEILKKSDEYGLLTVRHRTKTLKNKDVKIGKKWRKTDFTFIVEIFLGDEYKTIEELEREIEKIEKKKQEAHKIARDKIKEESLQQVKNNIGKYLKVNLAYDLYLEDYEFIDTFEEKEVPEEDRNPKDILFEWDFPWLNEVNLTTVGVESKSEDEYSDICFVFRIDGLVE